MRRLILVLCLIMALAMLPSVEGATHTGTLTVLADNDKSGYVANRNVNFTEAWTATDGTEFYLGTEFSSALCGLTKWSGKYVVIRHFYTFDTKEVKKNWRITSSFLMVDVQGTMFFSNWTAKIQKWMDTDDSVGLDDFRAFDEFFYDDGSMQEGDFIFGEYNRIPIRDDTLITKKGDTKVILRISDEVEGIPKESATGLMVYWTDRTVKLEINYEWATGSQAQPKSINFLPFVIGAIVICGGISFVALQKDKARRLYH